MPPHFIYISNFSPYASTTRNAADDVYVCGAGADQGFSFNLPPGAAIKISQIENDFDSKHTLRYGGEYPGEFVVSCVDDPDNTELTYKNSELYVEPVYFVVDAYSSSGSGDFTLEWEIGM